MAIFCKDPADIYVEKVVLVVGLKELLWQKGNPVMIS